MRSRSLRLLAALLATVLVLGACSDDGGSDDETATTAEPTTTEGDDEATTTTEADDDATTTTEADETSDEGEEASGGSIDIGALAEIDDFCLLNEESEDFEAADAIFGGDVDGPEDMEEAFLFMQAFFARIVEIAPDEIREDVVTVAGGVDEWMGLLADYEFDFAAMGAAAASDPDVAAQMEAINSEDFVTASENIDSWLETNCS